MRGEDTGLIPIIPLTLITCRVLRFLRAIKCTVPSAITWTPQLRLKPDSTSSLMPQVETPFLSCINRKFPPPRFQFSGSYAWKGILRGRDVILNGADIKIWQHCWLPIKHPPNITSPVWKSL